MGAEGTSSSIVCSQSATINLNLMTTEYDTKTTTLTENQKLEIIEKLKTAKTHEEELEKLKQIGAHTPILPSEIGTDFNFKRELVWKNILGFLLLHIIGVIGIGLGAFGFCDFRTVVYSWIVLFLSGQGVTMGAHRLWSHRAFKAKTWLKVILLISHTLAGQNCLWVWVRDHRQHHKYSDTDADPHNANRGFFFAHVGWLLSRKHPKVKQYGKRVDMSDIEADPWIMFQKRHYKLLYTIFAFGIPTLIPIYLFNEDPFMSLMVSFFARTILNLNITWCVNSVAHFFGTRPFDKTIYPVENALLSLVSGGEGWHNYHHAFPWDYKAAELGTHYNSTKLLIEFLSKYGITWDLREATHNMVKNRIFRTGDDTHRKYGTDEARNAIYTLFGIWKHELNPTYSAKYYPAPKTIQQDGYALIEAELSKSERDEKTLKAETKALIKKHTEEKHQQQLVNEKKMDLETFKGDYHIGDVNGNLLLSLMDDINDSGCNNNVRQKKS